MWDIAELLNVPLAPLPLPRPQRMKANGQAAQRGAVDDFWQMRSYQEGDAARSISWRASARRDDILVLERSAPRVPSCTVAIDVAAPDAAMAGKTAMMQALSTVLLYQLQRAGFAVRIGGLRRAPSRQLERLCQEVASAVWSEGEAADFLLTPLLQPLDRLRALCAHPLRVCCFLGKDEQTLPHAGMLRLYSSQGRVTLGEGGAQAYAKRLAAHTQAVAALGAFIMPTSASAALKILWQRAHAG